jgi:endonuclease-3
MPKLKPRMDKMDWVEALKPLLTKYSRRKHPLNYKNRYQLVVMTVLSAQDSDKHINEISLKFFEAFPSIQALAHAAIDDLFPYIHSVRNFYNKSKWLVHMAIAVGDNKRIPSAMAELTKLSGIGRKSANVIIRESGGKAEGIIVDLHVIRVAPRIGLSTGDKPDKIEKQLMQLIPQNYWNDVGMAISFLGREICRPKDPNCEACIMNRSCKYRQSLIKGELRKKLQETRKDKKRGPK